MVSNVQHQKNKEDKPSLIYAVYNPFWDTGAPFYCKQLEQKTAAIKGWKREQIDDGEVERNEGYKCKERAEAERVSLTCNLGNADWP